MARLEDTVEAQEEHEPFSLRDVGRTVAKYRGPLKLAALAIATLLILLCAIAYLLIPTERVTTLDFRLTFRGAERGEYPNGTKFSPAEIISPTVLAAVHKNGEYERFLSYDELKSSLFVVQSNDALESLTRAYRAKLSDPKLSAVDRARIEQEFEEKQASLSKAEYSISMVTRDRLRSVPISVRTKILNDTLSTWAEQTVKDKGVSLYDISVLSSGVFTDPGMPAYDYLVGLDVVRGKIDSVIKNVDQLLMIPGAKVLRTEKSKRSLAELRSRLIDLNEHRLQPLIVTVATEGISRNPAASIEFLKSQLAFTRLDVEEAQARATSVRDSLERYMQERQNGGETAVGGEASPGGSATAFIDRSVLDRIVELSGEASDFAYRQKLVDEYRKASMEVVPLESEARYYEMLLQSYSGRMRAATDAERTMIERETAAALADAVQSTNDINELYDRLSKDLNPSTMLYSLNDPVTSSNERAISGVALTVTAFVLLLLSLPVLLVGALMYDRLRAGNRADAEHASTAARNRSHGLAES